MRRQVTLRPTISMASFARRKLRRTPARSWRSMRRPASGSWVYQTVHRDIWDYDVPSQPVLVNIRKNGQGEVIPALAQPTKRGEIFLLDRRTGVPIYDTPEQPVPQNPAKGETVTATQPFSPLPNFREDRVEKDMWGMTPLDQLACRIEFKKMRYEGHFTPPMEGGGGYGQAQELMGRVVPVSGQCRRFQLGISVGRRRQWSAGWCAHADGQPDRAAQP